jgi:hypothetical protein
VGGLRSRNVCIVNVISTSFIRDPVQYSPLTWFLFCQQPTINKFVHLMPCSLRCHVQFVSNFGRDEGRISRAKEHSEDAYIIDLGVGTAGHCQSIVSEWQLNRLSQSFCYYKRLSTRHHIAWSNDSSTGGSSPAKMATTVAAWPPCWVVRGYDMPVHRRRGLQTRGTTGQHRQPTATSTAVEAHA